LSYKNNRLKKGRDVNLSLFYLKKACNEIHMYGKNKTQIKPLSINYSIVLKKIKEEYYLQSFFK